MTALRQTDPPYWLCCGSLDPLHSKPRQGDCLDPLKAVFETRTEHERSHSGFGWCAPPAIDMGPIFRICEEHIAKTARDALLNKRSSLLERLQAERAKETAKRFGWESPGG